MNYNCVTTKTLRFITSNIRNQIDYSPQLIYWLGAELEKNGQFEWTDDSRMSFQVCCNTKTVYKKKTCYFLDFLCFLFNVFSFA